MDPETSSSSSASCRVVVVSSSLETSREVAHRIKALSGDTSESQPSSEVVNWIIKNKYYTAPVYFHPIHIEGLEYIELDDVPAIIYAWKENDPYKTHMKHIAEVTTSFNPEVSLAISMTPTSDEQLEDFFFEHGFEYVDGLTEASDRSIGLYGSSATSGIHRAIDALSTIMWPSMVRTETSRTLLGRQPSLSMLEESEEVDINYQTLVNATGNDGKSNMQREMEMLEKWLDEDDDNYNLNQASVGDNSSYASLDSHEQYFSNDPWSTSTPGAQTTTTGFDDDFTEFVSASGPGTSLELEEDSGLDLPSEVDIRAASARIFGPTSGQVTGMDATGPLARSDPTTNPDHAGSADIMPELDMDSPAFDLTRILGALNDMKDEITRIPDMRERRRAAAKAALGFVYGLEDANSELDAAARLA